MGSAKRAPGLERFIYCSHVELVDGVQPSLGRILSASRRNNSRDHITGALAMSAGRFVQVVEGPPEKLKGLWDRLNCDPCHSNMAVLHWHPIQARLFAGWSMITPHVGPESPDLRRLVSGCGTSGSMVTGLLVKLTSNQHVEWTI